MLRNAFDNCMVGVLQGAGRSTGGPAGGDSSQQQSSEESEEGETDYSSRGASTHDFASLSIADGPDTEVRPTPSFHTLLICLACFIPFRRVTWQNPSNDAAS